MSTARKTTFLCIPGAMCPGYFYHKVTEQLQAKGFEAQYIDNRTLGRQSIPPGLEDDVEQIRTVATALLDAGKDVILVGNSYGGALASEVCKTLIPTARPDATASGVLKHLVILSSFLPLEGETMKVLAQSALLPDDPDEQQWLGPFPAEMAYAAFFPRVSTEEGPKYAAMTNAQAMKPLFQPLTFPGWKYIPTTYVVPENDQAVLPELQHQQFRRAVGSGGNKSLREVVLEGGDHIPMLSSPEEVVRVCIECAA